LTNQQSISASHACEPEAWNDAPSVNPFPARAQQESALSPQAQSRIPAIDQPLARDQKPEFALHRVHALLAFPSPMLQTKGSIAKQVSP